MACSYRHPVCLLALILLTGVSAASLAAQDSDPSPVDPAWLAVDTAGHVATFRLLAAFSGFNGGLNFNGHREGELRLLVPLGWTVVVQFENRDGVIPHSAEVIEDRQPVPAAAVPPAIPRAMTVRLEEGLPPGGKDTMRFRAAPAGKYLFFCAVAGHGAGGMWIRFEVNADAAVARVEHVTPPR